MTAIKSILKQSGLLFIGLMVSMWIGLFSADGLVALIVRMLFDASPFVERLCRIAGYLAVMSVAMAIYAGKIAFEQKRFCLWQTAVSVGLMALYQLAVAPIFKCAMYVSGAGWYLGEIFFGGAHMPIGQVGYADMRCYIWGMLICDVFYLIAICIGGFVGYRKHEKVVEKLKTEH